MSTLLNLIWAIFVLFVLAYAAGSGFEYGRNQTWRRLNRKGKSADPGSD